MKKDFDFDEIGKKVPYQVPEGLFEAVQKNVMERVERPKRRKSVVLRYFPVAFAAAAVLAAVLYLPLQYHEKNTEQISLVTSESNEWIEDLSDEDLEVMDEFSENDIFMN